MSGPFGYFYSDGLTRIMCVTISSIYLTSVAYSFFYIKRVKEPFLRFRWYYCLLNLFAFTMLLAVTTNNLGFIWIAVEATTVTSALLVALERERTSIEAAWRYTLIVSAGLVISLLSVIFVYSSQGTLIFSDLAEQHLKNSAIMSIAVALALIGYGTKAGIAPMHAWLPDAHSEAPSPISAMFSAILLPTALYAFVRMFGLLHGTPTYAEIRNLVIGFGIFTALLASIIMGHQRNYKRMLAYSSMENMGIILVGFALGDIAAMGAVIQIIAHAFAKSSAFYEAGNIIVAYNTKNMFSVQGVVRKLRATGYLFTMSCFSITGAPPFGVFLGEFLILSQALRSGNFIVAILLAITYIYAFIGLNRQSIQMIFGPSNIVKGNVADSLTVRHTSVATNGRFDSKKSDMSDEIANENWISILIPLVNLVISLIIGVYMFPVILQASIGISSK
ncbi:MAG: proton-conducting transporter membrane subunit [Nitrososphaeraceae archaeon]